MKSRTTPIIRQHKNRTKQQCPTCDVCWSEGYSEGMMDGYAKALGDKINDFQSELKIWNKRIEEEEKRKGYKKVDDEEEIEDGTQEDLPKFTGEQADRVSKAERKSME